MEVREQFTQPQGSLRKLPRTSPPAEDLKTVFWGLLGVLVLFVFLFLGVLGYLWSEQNFFREEISRLHRDQAAAREWLPAFRQVLGEFSSPSVHRFSQRLFYPLTEEVIFSRSFQELSYQTLEVSGETSVLGNRFQTRFRGEWPRTRSSLFQFYLPHFHSAWSGTRRGLVWIRGGQKSGIYTFRLGEGPSESGNDSSLTRNARGAPSAPEDSLEDFPQSYLTLVAYDANEEPLRLRGPVDFEITLSGYADRETGERIDFPQQLPWSTEADDWDRYLMCRP